MSEGNVVDCPTCGELVSAGALCEECGAELPTPAESKEPVQESNMTRVPFAVQSTETELSEPEVPNLDREDLSDVVEARQVLQAVKTEVPKVEVKPASLAVDRAILADEGADEDLPHFTDDCPHFRLEFNDARVFVQDWTASFNFRITPTSVDSRQCRLPQLEVRIQGSDVLKQTIWGLNRGGAQEVDVNFSPKYLGFEIASEVHLSYQLNGKSHSYVSRFKWDCVRPEESSKVIENLVIKMENVEAGMAADQNINILKDFKAKQSHSLSSRLQDLKLKPIWKRLELFDVTEGTAPAPKGLVSRLSLVGPGGARLHLLGGNRFAMGRSEELDITTMLFKTPDCPDKKLTTYNGVSRYQAVLALQSGSWRLRDGGIDPSASLARVKASSYGTFLNGRKIVGAPVLETGTESIFTFGKSSRSDKHVFGFECTVVEDPESGKPSAVLLERIDHVRESFLCLAGQMRFEDLFPGIGAGKLRFHKGGFSLTKSGQEKWLKPGVELNESWTCEEYRQIGF